MSLIETFQMAVQNILSSKMRTFLTMLGIIIGVCAVIVIVGLGNGMQGYIEDSFADMGTDSLTVMVMGRGSSRSVSEGEMYQLVADNSDVFKHAFLCFEGVEKVLHMLEARKHKEDPAQSQQRLEKLAAQDPLKFEKDKIKGAIRTDFILSAEIVAITLGIVAEAPLLNQVLVLSGIALVVTVGVYGLVGVIVKIDDLGYWLAEKSSALMQALGKGLLIIAPWLMKALSIVGTLAMFLVGGGIVVHGIAPLHHAIEHFAGQQSAVVAMILPTVLNLILGFIIGGIVVLGVKAVAKIRGQAH